MKAMLLRRSSILVFSLNIRAQTLRIAVYRFCESHFEDNDSPVESVISTLVVEALKLLVDHS